MSGAAAVCTSAGSPQDRRARAGFASGSALATDGNAAPHAAAGEFRAGAVYLVTARSPAGRFPAGLAGQIRTDRGGWPLGCCAGFRSAAAGAGAPVFARRMMTAGTAGCQRAGGDHQAKVHCAGQSARHAAEDGVTAAHRWIRRARPAGWPAGQLQAAPGCRRRAA